MKIKFALAVAVAALSIVPAAAQDAPASDFKPIVTKSETLGAPPAGKAQVIFWRPGTFIGAALGCTVREGVGTEEVEVARLGAGKYWSVFAEPGKHQYYTTGEATDRLNLELEPDETYYVRCSIGMGIVAGRAQLAPSDRGTFEAKAKGMKRWEPKGDQGKGMTKGERDGKKDD